MPILNTSRIRLRRLENSDLEQLHALFSDAEVMKYLDDFKPYTRIKSESARKNAQASYRTFGYGPGALIHRATNGFVGIDGIEMLPQRSYPEITYIIGRDWWGQGLASEIAISLVAYGIDVLGLATLGASVDPRNAASVRIIKKTRHASLSQWPRRVRHAGYILSSGTNRLPGECSPAGTVRRIRAKH